MQQNLNESTKKILDGVHTAYSQRNGANQDRSLVDRNKWSAKKNVENKSTNKSHSSSLLYIIYGTQHLVHSLAFIHSLPHSLTHSLARSHTRFSVYMCMWIYKERHSVMRALCTLLIMLHIGNKIPYDVLSRHWICRQWSMLCVSSSHIVDERALDRSLCCLIATKTYARSLYLLLSLPLSLSLPLLSMLVLVLVKLKAKFKIKCICYRCVQISQISIWAA